MAMRSNHRFRELRGVAWLKGESEVFRSASTLSTIFSFLTMMELLRLRRLSTTTCTAIDRILAERLAEGRKMGKSQWISCDCDKRDSSSHSSDSKSTKIATGPTAKRQTRKSSQQGRIICNPDSYHFISEDILVSAHVLPPDFLAPTILRREHF